MTTALWAAAGALAAAAAAVRAAPAAPVEAAEAAARVEAAAAGNRSRIAYVTAVALVAAFSLGGCRSVPAVRGVRSESATSAKTARPIDRVRAKVESPTPDPTLVDATLDSLRELETEARSRTDFAHASPSEKSFGPDPYVIRRVVAPPKDPGFDARFIGILRGRSALVELDGALGEIARLPAPESATGVSVAANGEVFVVGELSSRVARYQWVGGKLQHVGDIELSDVRAIRDVGTGREGLVYVTEEHDGRLITVRPRPQPGSAGPAQRVDTPLCHGPIHVLRVATSLIVVCLLDHTVVVMPTDAQGFPVKKGETRIVHDGPIWGLDAVDDASGALLAVGGVEDHRLDRTQGSFGFVDSFVRVYRIAHGHAVLLHEANTSALGVITPKALSLARAEDGALDLAVAGYGSNVFARLRWSRASEHEKGGGEPSIATSAIPPGTAMIQRLSDNSFVLANPLIDAWAHLTEGSAAIVHVDDLESNSRTTDLRLGEALFFTSLMAPWDRADGRLSRFTCETCHFEGYVDGRTHSTGRENIVATTKPLLGLFSNRPHFSRALDPDLTTMVNNEFRVAGAKSDHDPWFSLDSDDFPWTAELGIEHTILTPEHLRRALMTFFMNFSHRPNPAAFGRTHFTDLERAGAALFREDCESCHQARLVTDEPSTRQPFERWESLVLTPEGPVVWARADYEKTGVTPYVNENGARVVSLRRLYKKFPYFTNGSAKSIADVLDQVCFGVGFLHEGGESDAKRLGLEEKKALAAFLDLL